MTIRNSGHDSPPPCAQRNSFCDVVFCLYRRLADDFFVLCGRMKQGFDDTPGGLQNSNLSQRSLPILIER